jgi:hypothetical protein
LLEQVGAETLIHNDMVVLNHVFENYFNVTHQTLEIFRFVAVDPTATHILKVSRDCAMRHWLQP